MPSSFTCIKFSLFSSQINYNMQQFPLKRLSIPVLIKPAVDQTLKEITYRYSISYFHKTIFAVNFCCYNIYCNYVCNEYYNFHHFVSHIHVLCAHKVAKVYYIVLLKSLIISTKLESMDIDSNKKLCIMSN